MSDGVDSDTGPFAMVPEWLLYSGISGNAVKLFCILHRYDGLPGGAHPSRATLAKRMQVSVDTVDRTLKELIDAGAVATEGRFTTENDRDSNAYMLHFLRPGSRTDAATGGGTDAATGSRKDAAGKRIHISESTWNENPPSGECASAPTPTSKAMIAKAKETADATASTFQEEGMDEIVKPRARTKLKTSMLTAIEDEYRERLPAMAESIERCLEWPSYAKSPNQPHYLRAWLERDIKKLNENGRRNFNGGKDWKPVGASENGGSPWRALGIPVIGGESDGA